MVEVFGQSQHPSEYIACYVGINILNILFGGWVSSVFMLFFGQIKYYYTTK
jgi:hypothetical protein